METFFITEEKTLCLAANCNAITNQITHSSTYKIKSCKTSINHVDSVTYLTEEFFLLCRNVFNSLAAVSELKFLTAERLMIICGSLDSLTFLTDQYKRVNQSVTFNIKSIHINIHVVFI